MAVMTKLSKRERLIRLVNELPDSELTAAERYLEYLRNVGSDPVARALASAPYDDAPLTPEQIERLKIARAQAARGETISDADLWRELGHEPRS